MEKSPERKNGIRLFALSGLIVGVFFLLLAVFFDFYFDLNDDVLMKDILSGIYTGHPSAWNIQMLWPISALISRLYVLVPVPIFDMYGFVLLLLQWLSLSLILTRVLSIMQRYKVSLIMQGFAATAVLLPLGTMAVYHAVFVQYSVTTAFLLSAAAFLFITMDLPKDPDEAGFTFSFVKACLPSIILIAVSYPLRSEMTLLLLPLVLVAALFRYLQCMEKETGTFKENMKSIFHVTGILSIFAVLGVLALLLAGESILDSCMCSSDDWQHFRTLFDARTDLYDYDGAPPVPDYDEYVEAYTEAGLNESQVELFNNYNFGLDESITDETMEAVEKIAAADKASHTTTSLRISDMLWNYRNSLVSPDYAPYNIFVAAGYILIFLTAISEFLHETIKEKNLLIVYRARRAFGRVAFSLVLLFIVRTLLWLFIFWGGRYPDRITHSLLMVEMAVLCGLLFMRGPKFTIGDKKPAGWSIDVFSAEVLLIAAAVMFLPGALVKVHREQVRREEVNVPYEAYLQYCGENTEYYYFTDVYSTVDFSEKMFADYPGDSLPANRDIAGGWASKSPLYREKMEARGYTDMATALTDAGDARFVIEKDGDMDWLVSWYKETKGQEVTAKKVDSIGDYFDVYEIVRKSSSAK